MATYHAGYKDIKVTLLGYELDSFAEKVYEFGRLSHDYYEKLPEKYNKNDQNCSKLIQKIIDGKTLPKFALMGTRFQFCIEGISRICLAQLTRDSAIFASGSGGVFPLSQDLNIPLSVYLQTDIMEKVFEAQKILEEAYIMCCEREIPTLESRYIGLHCQTISLTASYTPSDFVRSCFSRTSSNFCDECNYVYRLMYRELIEETKKLNDKNSLMLWNWILSEDKCINDKIYTRERLYNSDFTDIEGEHVPDLPAFNDWRKSGWKTELERMYLNNEGYLTRSEELSINRWLNDEVEGKELHTTYDGTRPDVAKNCIKNTLYYKEHR